MCSCRFLHVKWHHRHHHHLGRYRWSPIVDAFPVWAHLNPLFQVMKITFKFVSEKDADNCLMTVTATCLKYTIYYFTYYIFNWIYTNYHHLLLLLLLLQSGWLIHFLLDIDYIKTYDVLGVISIGKWEFFDKDFSAPPLYNEVTIHFRYLVYSALVV